MRVISRKRLLEFGDAHAAAKAPLEKWHLVTSKAKWTCLDDVRNTFAHADEVKVNSGRTVVVFNVGGNNYRLITSIYYPAGAVYIKMLLTHAEYNKDKWKGIL